MRNVDVYFNLTLAWVHGINKPHIPFRRAYHVNGAARSRLALRLALHSLWSLPAGGAEQERVLPHDPGPAYRLQSFRDPALIKAIPVPERNPA